MGFDENSLNGAPPALGEQILASLGAEPDTLVERLRAAGTRNLFAARVDAPNGPAFVKVVANTNAIHSDALAAETAFTRQVSHYSRMPVWRASGSYRAQGGVRYSWLATDWINGRRPSVPLLGADAERLAVLAAQVTPSADVVTNVSVFNLAKLAKDNFHGWKLANAQSSHLQSLGDEVLRNWAQAHLHKLMQAEEDGPALLKGSSLVHLDAGCHNAFFDERGPEYDRFIDWAPGRGPQWVTAVNVMLLEAQRRKLYDENDDATDGGLNWIVRPPNLALTLPR